MTDRVQGFLVHLDDDYRIGDRDMYPSLHGDGNEVLLPTDADAIAHAIRMIKGVTKVEPIIADYQDHLARERARGAVNRRVLDALREKK